AGIVWYHVGALSAVNDAYAERCAGNGAIEGLHFLHLVREFEDGIAPALRLYAGVRGEAMHFDAVLPAATSRRNNRTLCSPRFKNQHCIGLTSHFLHKRTTAGRADLFIAVADERDT